MVQPLPAFLACAAPSHHRQLLGTPESPSDLCATTPAWPFNTWPTIPSVQLSPILLPQLYTYLNNGAANVLFHGAHLSMAKGCILLFFSLPTSNPAPNPATSRAALLN